MTLNCYGDLMKDR